MTVIAVTMVRDEQDVIGYTLLHLLAEGVDHIIVSDNLSTDHTLDIMSGLADDGAPITILTDLEPGYYQDRKMSGLSDLATEMGADWVLPFDADEIWYAETGTISDTLNACDADIVGAQGWDHIATHGDPANPNPFRSITRRRTTPQTLPKVAYRAFMGAHLHMGNHDVDRPGTRIDGLLTLRHFQYRSLAQMTTKVRNGREAYEASDLHWNYGTHWRTLGALPDDALAAHWADLCLEPGLVDDPAPYRASL
jgi:hypothetical protein